MTFQNATATSASHRHGVEALLAAAAVWFAVVCYGASSGFLRSLDRSLIAALIAASVALPTLGYALSPPLRAYVQALGQRPLLLLHVWRIAAALLFFWYGAQGQLPPLFWTLAGGGDLIVGLLALGLAVQAPTAGRYLGFHLIGFADLVVAVGTGLASSLLGDPRMALIASLPLALIPLFGVGITGASHLVALDMLRRGIGVERR